MDLHTFDLHKLDLLDSLHWEYTLGDNLVVNLSSLEGMNSRICPLVFLEGQNMDHMGWDHKDPLLQLVRWL